MKTTNLKTVQRMLSSAVLTATLVTLAACSGSSSSAEDKEFTLIPRNDWQKMGLYGTPKRVSITYGPKIGEYYLFNSLGYLTEYGERVRNEAGKLEDRALKLYTYDTDSTTLLSMREYGYSQYNQNGKPNLYIDYEYDKWGNVTLYQFHSTRDYTSSDPKYTSKRPQKYTFVRTGERTYDELEDSVLKRRHIYDQYHNPVKITVFESDGNVFKVFRWNYQYNDDGLMTAKIDYAFSNYDYDFLTTDPTPEILWRYRYSEKGVLTATEWAPVVKLPEGWEKDIEGLDKSLFVPRPDAFCIDKDDKAIIQHYQRYNDIRGNWGSLYQYAPTKVTIKRSISYYDETDVPEPQNWDEDSGC